MAKKGYKLMEMIAYCGLNCTECPALIATKENNEEKVKAIAAEWAKAYGANITADSVWCDGCLVGGKKCGHCHECEIRACGMKKGVKNCAHCAQYPCGKLEAFFALAPVAKNNLEAIKARL